MNPSRSAGDGFGELGVGGREPLPLGWVRGGSEGLDVVDEGVAGEKSELEVGVVDEEGVAVVLDEGGGEGVVEDEEADRGADGGGAEVAGGIGEAEVDEEGTDEARELFVGESGDVGEDGGEERVRRRGRHG
jgi:hypothetical protein